MPSGHAGIALGMMVRLVGLISSQRPMSKVRVLIRVRRVHTRLRGVRVVRIGPRISSRAHARVNSVRQVLPMRLARISFRRAGSRGLRSIRLGPEQSVRAERVVTMRLAAVVAAVDLCAALVSGWPVRLGPMRLLSACARTRCVGSHPLVAVLAVGPAHGLGLRRGAAVARLVAELCAGPVRLCMVRAGTRCRPVALQMVRTMAVRRVAAHGGRAVTIDGVGDGRPCQRHARRPPIRRLAATPIPAQSPPSLQSNQ
jgi:hypothetical protein